MTDLDDRWRSMPAERTVLFVARTLQSTTRLLHDVLPLIGHDTRIRTLFTIDTDPDARSRFDDRVPGFLDAHHVKQVPWAVATAPDFHCDLTVSASVHRNLAKLPKPLLVMSHGAGHHKHRATAGGVDASVSGLSEHQLRDEDGVVIPTVIALGGPEQLDRLRKQSTELADRAVITGDICLDRLRHSANQRHRYRRQLGVLPGQKLVFVSSTWGPDSLLARRPRLWRRLVANLPADEYRVVTALHPNVWAAHGDPTGVGAWLSPQTAPGLTVLPPEEGWRAALLASDLVFADHGSVGFYGAALGIPLAFATFSGTEVPADSPAAALSRVSPTLDVDGDLAEQTERLSRSRTDHGDITRPALDTESSAADRLHALIHRELDLVAEPRPPMAPLPIPIAVPHPLSAHHVHVDPGDPTRVLRRPVSESADEGPSWPHRVLVVDAVETDESRRTAASVAVWTETSLRPGEAEEWAETILAELPGLRLAAVTLVDGGLFLRFRTGATLVAEYRPPVHPASVAAVAHVAALRGTATDVTLSLGSSAATVTVRPLSD